MRGYCGALIVGIFCLIASGPIFCQETGTFSEEQMASYNQAIVAEVQKQDALAMNAMQAQKENQSMSIGEAARLSVIVTMAEVKHILADNFLNSPSLNSPKVRDLFLQIMQKEVISQEDLLVLQSVVMSEAGQTAPATPTGPTAPAEPVVPTMPAAPTAPAAPTEPSSTLPAN